MRMTERDPRAKTLHLLPTPDSPTLWCGIALYKRAWTKDPDKATCARCIRAKEHGKPVKPSAIKYAGRT
jgi:hypothetical protein